jgi:hypothetical protein
MERLVVALSGLLASLERLRTTVPEDVLAPFRGLRIPTDPMDVAEQLGELVHRLRTLPPERLEQLSRGIEEVIQWAVVRGAREGERGEGPHSALLETAREASAALVELVQSGVLISHASHVVESVFERVSEWLTHSALEGFERSHRGRGATPSS